MADNFRTDEVRARRSHTLLELTERVRKEIENEGIVQGREGEFAGRTGRIIFQEPKAEIPTQPLSNEPNTAPSDGSCADLETSEKQEPRTRPRSARLVGAEGVGAFTIPSMGGLEGLSLRRYRQHPMVAKTKNPNTLKIMGLESKEKVLKILGVSESGPASPNASFLRKKSRSTSDITRSERRKSRPLLGALLKVDTAAWHTALQAGSLVNVGLATVNNLQQIVEADTIDGLVFRLVADAYHLTDPNYLDDFLLVYKAFLTPHQLLQKLSQLFTLYSTLPSDGTTETKEDRQRRIAVCLRIVAVLRTWIERQYGDMLADAELVNTVKKIAEECITALKPPSPLAAASKKDLLPKASEKQLRRTLSLLSDPALASQSAGDMAAAMLAADEDSFADTVDTASNPAARRIESPTISGRSDTTVRVTLDPTMTIGPRGGAVRPLAGSAMRPGAPPPPTLPTLKASEIAEQLAALDRQMFCAIDACEWMNYVWTPEHPMSFRHVTAVQRAWRRISQWAASEVLRQPYLDRRIETVAKFIKIAKHLRALRDFSACFAIVAALLSPPIGRLRRTWEGLPPADESDFDQLLALVATHASTFAAHVQFLANDDGDAGAGSATGDSVNACSAAVAMAGDGGRGAIVPYVELFTIELGQIKEEVSKHVCSAAGKETIDFRQLRRMAVVIKELQKLQELASNNPRGGDGGRGGGASMSGEGGGAVAKGVHGEDEGERPDVAEFLRRQLASTLPDDMLAKYSMACETDETGTAEVVVMDNMEEDITYVIREGRFIVRKGTLDKLIEKLYDPWVISLDPFYVDEFLLASAFFIKPTQLLQRLSESYDIALPDNALRQFFVQRRAAIRMRVMDIMKRWLKNHFHELKRDTEFVKEFIHFVDTTTFLSDDEASFFLFLRERFSPSRESKRTPRRSSVLRDRLSQDSQLAAASPTTARVKLFTKTFARDVARQLTLTDHQLLSAIRSDELIKKRYTKVEQSPNVHAMIWRFNKISYWVASTILAEYEVARRAELLGHFIRLAAECRGLNNFNSCYAIVAGINFVSVSRLKRTWEQVPSATIEKFRELEVLFDFRGNNKNYRDALAKELPPLVPFVGCYLKNLLAIEENNPDEFVEPFPTTSEEDNTGQSEPRKFVNFEKFIMLSSNIRDLQTAQRTPYIDIERDDSLTAILEDLLERTHVSDEELHARSLVLEPPPSTAPQQTASASELAKTTETKTTKNPVYASAAARAKLQELRQI